MFKVCAALAGIALMSAWPQSPSAPPPAPTVHTSTISGSVVRVGANTPIGGARVVAARVGGPITEYKTATTDDGGRYAFQGLSAGQYRLFAEHELYLGAEYGRRLVGASGTPVDVVDGQIVSSIVIAMTPPGAIAGRVLDRGRPARGIWVRALKVTYVDGQKSYRVVTRAQSDDRGEFRLFGLVPGLYLVSAMPFPGARIVGDEQRTPVIPSIANGNIQEVVAPLAPESLDPAALDAAVYPGVFHPGTTDIARALPVDVRAGETTPGIVLSIARLAPHTIRGRLAGLPDGLSVQVGASPRPMTPTMNSLSGQYADGAFVINGVPSGRYTVYARSIANGPRGTGPPASYFAIATVDVGDRDVDNLTLTLAAGLTVTGVLTIDGHPPAAGDPPVSVQLITTGAPIGGAGAVRTQPEGTFAIPGIVAGVEYIFRTLQTPRPLFVKSAHFGADDVTVAPFTVGNGSDRSLAIELSTKTSTLDAQVVDRDERPVSGALVILVPDPARRVRSSLFKSGTTDAQGRVHLDGIAPGEYKAFASGDIDAASWQDPDILKTYESRGTVVRLAEGAGQTITVRILQ